MLLLIAGSFFSGQAQSGRSGNIRLSAGWQMQSAMKVQGDGSVLSKPGTAYGGWYKVSVPTTVIAGLAANKKFGFDPFYGRNLEKINGPEYDSAWWFRKEFVLPDSARGRNTVLILHGINYRANVWLNGKKIADSSLVTGPFRIFNLDISKAVHTGRPNVLAIEITRPIRPNHRDGDLAIDYADWIHYPADYNCGIVNDVEIAVFDRVRISFPLVTTKFDLPSLDTARLHVYAEVENYSDDSANAVLSGRINDSIRFRQDLALAPHEHRTVEFTADSFPRLNMAHPRIWWPWQYGKPELNRIALQLIRNKKTASSVAENFGIRQITSKMLDTASRQFIINGKPILLRGAAWSPDIFLRRSAEKQEQELKLVRDMNMNVVRSEGKLEDDHFYELCDRAGLMVMTGWMCCGAWQWPQLWDSTRRNIAMESQRSVMYWLRNKASVFVWLNGSDLPPHDTTVESDYLRIEKDLHWPNEILATANESVSKVSGRSGVKMAGPYDWVPPVYWESDPHKVGGPWSFATEISTGPSIPPMESLLKFIPKDSLDPNNALWKYHSGTMQFGNTGIFDTALARRYGAPDSIQDYVMKAQAQNYEGERAMMEAYGLRKYRTATGVVQWMLNNPWPGLIWHTFDYYLYPGGSYFGIKKALEPLHVQYSNTSRRVAVNNSGLETEPNLAMKATMYKRDGSVLFENHAQLSVGPDSVWEGFSIPQVAAADSLAFLRLEMRNRSGEKHSVNWYWISSKPDQLDFKKSTWYHTPHTGYTDFSALKNLPSAPLELFYGVDKSATQTTVHMRVRNTGTVVAFFVHIRLLNKKAGSDILPVLFDDNYFLLAPGETRALDAGYLNKDTQAPAPFIEISSWNMDLKKSKGDAHSGFVKAGK